jgi:lysine 2,3-aminomutase
MFRTERKTGKEIMGIMRIDTIADPEPDPESEPPSPRGRSAVSTTPLYAVSEEYAATPVLDTSLPFRTQSLLPEAQVAFRKRFFPKAKQSDWNNWHWQMRNRIHSFESLERFIALTDDERAAFEGRASTLPLSMTPYYLSLLDPNAADDPIRRCVVPSACEWTRSSGEDDDPLGEDDDSPIPGLVHRYPDRVLFLATNLCSTYCRYCTRSRMVGTATPGNARKLRWMRCIEYIRQHAEVRDVLISGGDPLTLSDDEIDWLLGELRAIEHVEILRIGTKVPAVMPQRVTDRLLSVLRRYHPLFLSLHFTHPIELTPDCRRACEKLADAGIPLGSQTVLLKGINDSVDVMKRLFHGLLRQRVRPYYLYQCDRIPGSAHFTAPVSTGLDIIRGLRGHTTGYAIPQYVIDAPHGGGKIPLLPPDCLGRDGGDILLRNFTDRVFRYPDAPPSPDFDGVSTPDAEMGRF